MNVLSERADKQCTYCFTLFKTTAQLRAHPCTNWTRGVGDEKFQCAKCAKTFFDEECFGEHEQTCEFDRRPQCTKCSQTFRSESLLTQHKELCTFGDSP